MRVEDVTQMGSGKRSRWTTVLGTERGKGVRADYRCTSAAPGERYLWEQDLEGTPFERILSASETVVRLEPAAAGTRVTLELRQRLRGSARLGAFLVRRAARRQLDDALSRLAELHG